MYEIECMIFIPAFIAYFLKGNIRFHSNDGVNSKIPPPPPLSSSTSSDAQNRPVSPRLEEFQKKLREKTPIGKLGSLHPNRVFCSIERVPSI